MHFNLVGTITRTMTESLHYFTLTRPIDQNDDFLLKKNKNIEWRP